MVRGLKYTLSGLCMCHARTSCSAHHITTRRVSCGCIGWDTGDLWTMQSFLYKSWVNAGWLILRVELGPRGRNWISISGEWWHVNHKSSYLRDNPASDLVVCCYDAGQTCCRRMNQVKVVMFICLVLMHFHRVGGSFYGHVSSSHMESSNYVPQTW